MGILQSASSERVAPQRLLNCGVARDGGRIDGYFR
jgi:hypothetical protein